MSEVELRNLEKKYDRTSSIIKKINLTVHTGEFVVVVGPSGCGKSTLLRMIAGLESISSGELYIDHRLVNSIPGSKRELAMVFQEYALYPHMTVQKNMSFGLEQRRMSRSEIESRVSEAAELLKLKDHLDRKPAELSGGQRQRVAIGRAIVKKPKVFLFDEPFSNLDAQLRVQMRTELSGLHRKIGSTTLFVTHDQVEAMSLADRIVILKDGVIQQVGAPLEVYQFPANRFVGAFIGNPGMNFILGIYQQDQNLFQTKNFRLQVDRDLGPGRSGEYYLGIRPENILISDPDQGDFNAVLRSIERYGYENHYVCEVEDQVILVRISSVSSAKSLEGFNPGTRLALRLKPNEIHWFETDLLGKRIDPHKGQNRPAKALNASY